MGCWPKNGLLDMNKGLSLQHIGRPHSGIGQSPAHTPVPGHTEGLWGSLSAPAGCSLQLGGAGRRGGVRREWSLPAGKEGVSQNNFQEEAGVWALGGSQVALDSEQGIPPWVASLAGDVLRGVGTSAYPPPVELEKAV